MSAPSVLVVDDDLAAAEDFARLISQRSGLGATFVSTAAEAITIVGGGGVAVVVLDQQMPGKSGTDLYLELRNADPQIRAILLTGEATREEVGAALNLGFQHYIHKPNALAELADVVRSEFIEHQNHLLSRVPVDQPVLYARRRGLFWGSKVTYRFVGLQILNESLTKSDEWREVLTLQAGETQRTKISRASTWTVSLEHETSERLRSTLSISPKRLAGFKGELQAEVSARLKKSFSDSLTFTEELEQTFSLPPEPPDVHQLHVRVRRVQQAPVYIEARVELLSDCTCCGRPSLIPMRVLVATGSVALRHVDRHSDSSTRTVDLGRTASIA